MKLFRGIVRVISCILMPVLLLAFIVTLFSMSATYFYSSSSETVGKTLLMALNVNITFLSPLLKGNDLGFIYTASGDLSDVAYSIDSGVSFKFDISNSDIELLTPSFSFNTMVLIGACAIIVGVFLYLCLNNKWGASLSALIIIAASVFLFTQGCLFDPFQFVLISSEEGAEPLINLSAQVPYLSSGATLIGMMVLSLAGAILSLTKKKTA